MADSRARGPPTGIQRTLEAAYKDLTSPPLNGRPSRSDLDPHGVPSLLFTSGCSSVQAPAHQRLCPSSFPSSASLKGSTPHRPHSAVPGALSVHTARSSRRLPPRPGQLYPHPLLHSKRLRGQQGCSKPPLRLESPQTPVRTQGPPTSAEPREVQCPHVPPTVPASRSAAPHTRAAHRA